MKTAITLFSVFAVIVISQQAYGMPNFARKYSVACGTCHTTIPKLNEYGYQFRKAGFVPAPEIGQEQKAKFEEIFAARIQGRYDYKRHNAGLSNVTTTNQMTLHEVTLYPISGSFGRHMSSLTELSLANEDFMEIENAYFRYTRGSEEAWFAGRVGIFHPFEGYGASDRPYSLSRPFFQTNAANHNGSTYFTPWNFDQAGIELAYVRKQTSISATLFNGLFVKNDEGAFKAFPAVGGNLQRAGGFSNKNTKDFQLFINQILKDNGSGVSAYFYRGTIDLPIPGTAADTFGPGTSFGNDFYREAIYGSWMVQLKLGFQGGYQWGQDHFYDTTAKSSSNTFKSHGWFGEVDAPLSDHIAVGTRLDNFVPSEKADHNRKSGVTVFANMPFNDGLQIISEYQHVEQQRSGKDTMKDNNVQLRFIWIW